MTGESDWAAPATLTGARPERDSSGEGVAPDNLSDPPGHHLEERER